MLSAQRARGYFPEEKSVDLAIAVGPHAFSMSSRYISCNTHNAKYNLSVYIPVILSKLVVKKFNASLSYLITMTAYLCRNKKISLTTILEL